MRGTRPRARRTPRRGAIAVEFALVLPLLIMLLLGVWDIGRLVNVAQILNNAVREGGRYASTGMGNTSQIRSTIESYLSKAGINTTGLTVTVANLTNTGNTDPTSASQLDQFQLTATLPSSSVRWIFLKNMIGSNTLQSTCVWSSMKDLPLTVTNSIPIN